MKRGSTRHRRTERFVAAWPRVVPGRFDEALLDVLARAATVLEAPRAALVWEETEEPYLHVALWSAGSGLSRTREAPGRMDPPVAEAVSRGSFLCADALRPESEVLHKAEDGLTSWRGAPLHADLRARLDARSVLAVPVEGKTLLGWLFALDKAGLTPEDLTLGTVVALQVATQLDHLGIVDQLRSAAAADERVRLARDLHDGVLQSLAAAALKLESAKACLSRDPEAARGTIEDVQAILLEEQQSLRAIAGSLKPSDEGAPKPEEDFAARVAEVCDRIQRHWGLSVTLRPGGRPGVVPGGLAHEACRIVHEALVNAARHGGASSAQVDVSRQGSDLLLSIEDDGRGFSFRGVYDLAELASRKMGPVALRERIAALGGALRVESSASGARLAVGLPLGQGGA